MGSVLNSLSQEILGQPVSRNPRSSLYSLLLRQNDAEFQAGLNYTHLAANYPSDAKTGDYVLCYAWIALYLQPGGAGPATRVPTPRRAAGLGVQL